MRAIRASSTEADKFAALQQICFPHAWPVEEWQAMLATPGTFAFGIDAMQGMLVLRSDGESADVITIAVHPSKRHQGMAQRLMQDAMEQLAQENIQRIMLEVSVENEAAIALYHQLGFTEITRRANYYRQPDGRFQDAVIMQRDL